MEDPSEIYLPVFQTWEMLYQGRAANLPCKESCQSQPKDGKALTSGQVQMARISRQWTIAELAARVHCEERVLADYERGQPLLPSPIKKRLKTELGL